MKKYLLTALLGVFGLFGFTSAISYTFVDDGEYQYSPDNFELTEDHTFSPSDFSNYSCDFDLNSVCYFTISTESPYDGNTCGFQLESSDSSLSYLGWAQSCTFSQGDTLYIGRDDASPFSTITLNVGSSGGGGSDGGMIEGGISALSPILSGLTNIVSELIPYVVYIGLGIVVATIGFVAIRWLMNRTQAKVRGTFSSGRRRK